MKSKGYTLWLMPKGKIYEKYANLIKKLAGGNKPWDCFLSENNAPVFEPHITLLGEIILPEQEIIKKLEGLISGQKPFSVILQNIGYEDFYFRALFIKAKKTKPLLTLHRNAKKIFNMQTISSFMPHLSLLYGNFPQALKDKIIKDIGKNQGSQFEISSVYLIKGGEVNNWRIVGEFPYTNPTSPITPTSEVG